MRERERDDLPGIGRVGEDLLVARHRGVEADLADRMSGRAQPEAFQDGPVGQHQKRRGFGFVPSPRFVGFRLGHGLLLAYYRVRGKGPPDSAPSRVIALNLRKKEGVPVLRDNINKALTEAMKAKNERAVSTLRMVNSTLKNADIEARGAGKPPLGDAEVLSLLQKMIKQRQESVELYQKGGRADLVKQEQEEISIIYGYLPKQMSDDEMKAAIEAAVKETGAAGMKDMGKVIGVLRGKYAGQMDMAKASGLVKARLQ